MKPCVRFNSLLFVAILFAASPLAAAPSASAGFDPAKLKEIPARVQKFVDDSTIAGAVTLVARQGQVASLEAVGYADLAAKTPMRNDNLFWIASMTKPMTAVAVLMLQDEGKLSVDDPVEKHLPEFKDQWLALSRSATNMTLVKPARPITVRDLLTHTSGLGDVPLPRMHSTLAELAMAYSQVPLKFQPGSKWEYCNSGINTLGRIVEVVSGRSFGDFMQKRLFDPLGMKETTFWPTPAQAKRIAKSYQPKQGGGLELADIWFIKGGISDRARPPFPSGGLFSTASDVARFYQMMLAGGEWRGERLLSRDAVSQLTHTQTGDIRTGFTDGMSWGLGFAVVKETKGVTGMLSGGTFGHGGAYGTQSWADPKKDLIVVLMIQRAKIGNADASDVRLALQQAAVAALAD